MTKKEYLAARGMLVEAVKDFLPPGNRNGERHVLQARPTLLDGFFEAFRPLVPPTSSGRDRLYVPGPRPGLQELEEHSNIVVFIGSALTHELMYFAQRCVILVFEPDRSRMDRFIEQLPATLAEGDNVYLFSGDPDSFPQPLYMTIPLNNEWDGPPIFFVREGVNDEYAQYIRDHVEIVYYHFNLYPWESCRQVPLRQMQAGHSFVQWNNLIVNYGLFAGSGTVEQLRGAYAGIPAVLVLAGPALEEQLEQVRSLREKCVVICANKVYRTLAEKKIAPDFVVLLDSSEASAQELQGVAYEPGTALVAYDLSGAAYGDFEKRYFFGHDLASLGLPMCTGDHYGSVANYMFFLARHMGCSTLFTAGLSLGSAGREENGYAFSLSPERVWPVAVAIPGKRILHTTLNFYDVALWLRAFIQQNDLKVINLTADSLLFGPTIEHASSIDSGFPQIARPLRKPEPEMAISPRSMLDILNSMFTAWAELRKEAIELLESGNCEHEILREFEKRRALYDAHGITHMLCTYAGYNPSSRFARLYDKNSTKDKLYEFRLYMKSLISSADVLLHNILKSIRAWNSKMRQ